MIYDRRNDRRNDGSVYYEQREIKSIDINNKGQGRISFVDGEVIDFEVV